MQKIVFICDISKTLLMMETEKGKINPYDDALKTISLIRFGGIDLRMAMAKDGQPFVHHIAEAISEAHRLVGLECDFNPLQAAREIIDLHMRSLLIKMFSEAPVLAAPGLGKFMASLQGLHGIVTGDLRAVTRVLMTYNSHGDLTLRFPTELWACGDDPDLTSRVDQVRTTYEKLGQLTEGTWSVFVDDAANSIAAMRQFATEADLTGSVLIIGVLTGNSGKEELIKAGANLVLPNVGEIPEALQSILG